MRFFTYNGLNSADYDIYLDNGSVLPMPERDIEEQKVIGRNGVLTFDNKRFENVTINLKCLIKEDGEKKYGAFLSRLLSFPYKYSELEDSLDPNHFRLATFKGGTDLEMISALRRQVTFTLKFDCRPERFLKSGNNGIIFTKKGILVNPSDHPSKPLIRIYGHGIVTIGTTSITVKEGATNYIEIDCDAHFCREGNENRNSLIELSNHQYPNLISGFNEINLSGNISKIEIVPRWWTL